VDGARERPHANPPQGVRATDEHGIKEVFAVEADLLRSEGIDPEWPGFAEESHDRDVSP